MIKILKYSFFDLIRSRWSLIYFLFYFISAWVLLYLGSDISKAITSLMNLTLILTPLIGTLFGVINYYNSRDFIELLLAQPVKRVGIFIGMYAGLSLSLALSFALGLGIPFLIYGLGHYGQLGEFMTLLTGGIFLTFIFTGLAFLIAINQENRLKGFGIAILVWLFMAFIYDGLFLLILFTFEDYPVEKLAIGLSLLNPIDLSRILVMLKLDISALMGYTGAVFNRFFGTATGMTISICALLLWCLIPAFLIGFFSSRKDF